MKLSLEPWSGGSCPVPIDQWVVVRLRRKHQPIKSGRAGTFHWNTHSPCLDTVEAYTSVHVTEADLTPHRTSFVPALSHQLVVVKLKGKNLPLQIGAADLFMWGRHFNCDETVYAYLTLDVDTSLSPASLAGDFIPFTADGRCPVPEACYVEAKLRCRYTSCVPASRLNWCECGENTIVEYRVVMDEKGFRPWSGGNRPVPEDVRVEVVLRNYGGRPYGNQGRAGHYRWAHELGGDDIVSYRIISPGEFTAHQGSDNPVPGFRVEIRNSEGGLATGWSDELSWDDVISYRIVG
jgi:hypothetical protein